MKENTAIAVFNSHGAAEKAVRQLQKGGFDVKKLSIIEKDYEIEDQAVGFYNAGDRVKYWGKMGAFWGAGCGACFSAPPVSGFSELVISSSEA